MPNWCYNSVTLENDDPKIIDEFEAVITKEDGQPFQYLRPMPDSEEENWYMWHVNNWGTKWDISVHDYERESPTSIRLFFDSAWSPPIAMYEYLNETGWRVDAQYQEEGMGFIGSYVDGEDNYYEYDISDRASIEALPQDLIDYGDLLTRHEDWILDNEILDNEEEPEEE